MLPGVCPGVWITSAGSVARPTVKPSSALASGAADLGCGNPEPAGLHLHRAQQTQILLVEKYRRPGCFLKQDRSAYVVDMGMGDDDLAQGEAMLLQPGENLRNVVSGIDDDGFMRNLVAQDGAIAAQRANGKTFKDHAIILGD